MTKKEQHEQAAGVCLAVLIRAQTNGDIEVAHSNADDALCTFLRALGYAEIVEAWAKVEKWYA